MRYMIAVLMVVVMMGCAIDTEPSRLNSSVGEPIHGQDLKDFWTVYGAWLYMGFPHSDKCTSAIKQTKIWRSSYDDLADKFPEQASGDDYSKGLWGGYIMTPNGDYVWIKDIDDEQAERETLIHEYIHLIQRCADYKPETHAQELFGREASDSGSVLACALYPSFDNCTLDKTEGSHD